MLACVTDFQITWLEVPGRKRDPKSKQYHFSPQILVDVNTNKMSQKELYG